MARQKTGGDYQRIPVKRGPVEFLDSLLGLGVGFRIDGDRLIALGDGASPVLQAEVDKRAPALIAILIDAGLQGGVSPRQRKEMEPDKMQLIRNGIEGAKQQAAKKKAMVQARRRARVAA